MGYNGYSHLIITSTCEINIIYLLKIIKTFTGYIQLKTFKLSAVRLQPSMKKNVFSIEGYSLTAESSKVFNCI